MRSLVRCTFIISIFLGLSSHAMAHEFLIKPELWTRYKSGQVLPIAVHSTHFFIKGVEIEDPKTVNVSYAGIRVPLTVNPAWLSQDGSVTLKGGGAALIEGHRLPILWSETPEGDAAGGRDINKNATSVASYEKFAKLLLPVEGNSAGFDKVCGHKLEIVPISNPLTAKVGDNLSFKVLLGGKPAAFEALEATYDGFTDASSAWAYSAAPTRHGEGVVKITAPGLWIVRVAMKLPGRAPVYDEEIIRAVLMFPVQ